MLNIQCNPAPAFSPQHRLCIRFLYWRGFFLPLFFRIQENGCVYQNRESAVSQISGICQDSSNHVLVPRFTGIVWNRGIVHEFRQLSNTHPHVISGKQVQHSAFLYRINYHPPRFHFIAKWQLSFYTHHLTVLSMDSVSSSPFFSRKRTCVLLCTVILSISSQNSSSSKASRISGPVSSVSCNCRV